MTSLIWERSWPYVGAVLVLAVWWFGLGHPFPAKPDALMGASGTVAAVFVGFLGTAKAIVLGLTSSAAFKKLKTTGYSKLLFAYLYEALFGGIIFLAIPIIGFFCRRTNHKYGSRSFGFYQACRRFFFMFALPACYFV
jgi:hypothetical protein